MVRIPFALVAGLAVVSALSLTPPAQAQVTFPGFRTVLVGPIPGDPVASGTRLLNALASISPTSCPGDYWLLRIAPGLYDVGTTALRMKPCVDVEGSGKGTTIITGTGRPGLGSGTVIGATGTELRSLTVRNMGGTDTFAVAYYANSAAVHLRHVTLTASGGGGATGTVGFRGALSGSGSLDGVTIVASGGFGNTGIECIAGTDFAIRNSVISASGGFAAHGVSSGGNISLEYTTITASNAVGTNSAVRDFGAVSLRHVVLIASGNDSVGIRRASGTGTITADVSVIRGETNTILNASGAPAISVGGSKLEGGPVSGSVTCAGVYDENYLFYPSTCP